MSDDRRDDGVKRVLIGDVAPEIVELADKLFAVVEGFEARHILSACACVELNVLLRMKLRPEQKAELYLNATEKMLRAIQSHG